MKKIYIVGAGLGAGSLTADAAAAIEESRAVFGAERLLSEYSALLTGKRLSGKYAARDVMEDVISAGEDVFSVLVSGDPGFYSAALRLCEAFRGKEGFDVKVLPGISSLNALFAALKMPWQDAALCSLHGRDANAADMVRRNRLTFFLTGKNTELLADRLIDAGFGGITLHVGEDLGSPQQKVFSCTAEELRGMELSSLTVVAAENPDADSRVRTGIPDDCFTRGDVPMTKAEVRAVIMSKLGIRPEQTCADIGAGTGSCTVEMALAAWKGRVYAVDPEPEAVSLIKQNCRAFHIGNVEAVQGLAPEDIKDWPPLDAVFVGGSKGSMKEIFDVVLGKNPKARIVTSAIVIQTVSDALSAFSAHGIVPEVVQISAAVSKRVGGKDMMMARNPIFLVSGGGSHCVKAEEAHQG